jgi:hypothetical protein
MKKTTLLFGAFVMLLSISIKAQTLTPTVLSSSGGFYTDGNTTLSFTVAEMTMVQTFTGGTNFLTQGFQQPELITVSIAENEVVPGEITVYPNPTSGAFNISYNTKNDGEYLVRIYDMVGQLVFAQSYAAGPGLNTIKVDIGQYRQGLYMLELSSTQLNGKKNSSIHKINLVY